jgi:serine/threonine-protein kinase RIO1
MNSSLYLKKQNALAQSGLNRYRVAGTVVCSHYKLSNTQLEEIKSQTSQGKITKQNVNSSFNTESETTRSLGGRGSTYRGSLEGHESVVIKHYHRGGVFGRLVEHSYLRFGAVRSEHEYHVLRKVRALGIEAPEPIAFAYRGGLIYEAWLITQEVLGAKSLAELVCESGSNAINITELVVEPVIKMIRHGIRHVDLHPGNVLIDKEGKLFLIDFDKATMHTGSVRALRDFYMRRWRRAVIKHELPEALSEVMCLKLKGMPSSDTIL